MLVDVSQPGNFHFVSSLGYSLGYLGGAVLLGMHVWMLTSPATFGLTTATQVIKVAFVSVGVWWAVFLIPLACFVPDSNKAEFALRGAIRATFSELKATVSHIRNYKNIVRFLIAYWLFMCGVFTIIFIAANYGQRLGFEKTDLVTALMITNFVGFPATLLYGVLGQRFGAKSAIYLALLVYIAVSIWAVFMTEVRQFYTMAIIVGCVQGGVQGLSRSLFATLMPQDRPGEFFGFYNMVTKFSHVIGPALVGISAIVTDKPGAMLLVLLPLFIGGGLLLTAVKIPPTDAESETVTVVV